MPSNIETKTEDRAMKHGVSQFGDTCLYMGQSCQELGAIDYGSNSNPTRRWPQFTIVEEVDVAVYTELSFRHTAKRREPWGSRPLWRYQRQTDFVEDGFDKTCGISDHEWFT